MKKVFIFIAILFFAAAGYVYTFDQPRWQQAAAFFYYSPCDAPLTYKLGSIDHRFNLSQDQLLTHTRTASALWNAAFGKQLIVYDPEAELTINLVYDRRQALNQEISSIEENVNSQKDSLEPEIAQYERDVAAFQAKLSDLNTRIAYWNSQGGAPKEEYDALIAEQNALQQESERLNAMADRLNVSARNYNTSVGRLQETIDTFNAELRRKPEEGLFDPNNKTISIYFVTDENELVHTIAHEFGHALGLSHIDDEQALMYPYSTEYVAVARSDRAALTQLCRKRSVVEVLQEQFSTDFLLPKHIKKRILVLRRGIGRCGAKQFHTLFPIRTFVEAFLTEVVDTDRVR